MAGTGAVGGGQPGTEGRRNGGGGGAIPDDSHPAWGWGAQTGSVPLGNESPDNRPGQLNPSPGTEGERLERRSQMLRLPGAAQTH